MFELVIANNKTEKVLIFDNTDLGIEWIPFNTMLNYMRKGLDIENVSAYYDSRPYNGIYTWFYSSADDYRKYYDEKGWYEIHINFPESLYMHRVLVSSKYNVMFYLRDNTLEIQYDNYYFKIEFKTVGQYVDARSYIEINGVGIDLKYNAY